MKEHRALCTPASNDFLLSVVQDPGVCCTLTSGGLGMLRAAAGIVALWHFLCLLCSVIRQLVLRRYLLVGLQRRCCCQSGVTDAAQQNYTVDLYMHKHIKMDLGYESLNEPHSLAAFEALLLER